MCSPLTRLPAPANTTMFARPPIERRGVRAGGPGRRVNGERDRPSERLRVRPLDVVGCRAQRGDRPVAPYALRSLRRRGRSVGPWRPAHRHRIGRQHRGVARAWRPLRRLAPPSTPRCAGAWTVTLWAFSRAVSLLAALVCCSSRAGPSIRSAMNLRARSSDSPPANSSPSTPVLTCRAGWLRSTGRRKTKTDFDVDAYGATLGEDAQGAVITVTTAAGTKEIRP